MTIAGRIKRSVSNRKGVYFFFTSDFASFGSRRGVQDALRVLVESGFLERFSLGMYAKTEWNEYARKRVPVMPLSCLAPMALERKGFRIELGKIAKEYAEGKSTQIPNMNIYEIGSQRISRKFLLCGRTIYYEKNGKRQKEYYARINKQ